MYDLYESMRHEYQSINIINTTLRYHIKYLIIIHISGAVELCMYNVLLIYLVFKYILIM